MSTKQLMRTVAEGGKHPSQQNRLHRFNRGERHNTKRFLREVAVDPDKALEHATTLRKRTHRFDQEHKHKLGAARRWFESHAVGMHKNRIEGLLLRSIKPKTERDLFLLRQLRVSYFNDEAYSWISFRCRFDDEDVLRRDPEAVWRRDKKRRSERKKHVRVRKEEHGAKHWFNAKRNGFRVGRMNGAYVWFEHIQTERYVADGSCYRSPYATLCLDENGNVFADHCIFRYERWNSRSVCAMYHSTYRPTKPLSQPEIERYMRLNRERATRTLTFTP